MNIFQKLNDVSLKFWVQNQCTGQNLHLGRRATYLRFAILLVLIAGAPLFAAPSATNNVVTRFAWFITQLFFYGTGAAVVLMGIAVPIAKKVLGGQRSETNPVTNILWAVGLFAAPSVLQLGVQFFNTDEGASGMLDDMQINLGGAGE